MIIRFLLKILQQITPWLNDNTMQINVYIRSYNECVFIYVCAQERELCRRLNNLQSKPCLKKTNESLLKPSESRFFRKEEKNDKTNEIKMIGDINMTN